MTEPKTPILIDGKHVTVPASHLSANEVDQPANAAYRGVMNERIERRKQ